MIAEKIEDIKGLTTRLFLEETFDPLLVRKVQIVTYNSFTIDGHIQKSFYTKEELEENQIEEFSEWKRLRPICFSLIKGKRLPNSFSIEFQLPSVLLLQFLAKSASSFRAEDVEGLYLKIRYEEGELSYVTGCSLRIFTMDKILERAWDEEAMQWMDKIQKGQNT